MVLTLFTVGNIALLGNSLVHIHFPLADSLSGWSQRLVLKRFHLLFFSLSYLSNIEDPLVFLYLGYLLNCQIVPISFDQFLPVPIQTLRLQLRLFLFLWGGHWVLMQLVIMDLFEFVRSVLPFLSTAGLFALFGRIFTLHPLFASSLHFILPSLIRLLALWIHLLFPLLPKDLLFLLWFCILLLPPKLFCEVLLCFLLAIFSLTVQFYREGLGEGFCGEVVWTLILRMHMVDISLMSASLYGIPRIGKWSVMGRDGVFGVFLEERGVSLVPRPHNSTLLL